MGEFIDYKGSGVMGFLGKRDELIEKVINSGINPFYKANISIFDSSVAPRQALQARQIRQTKMNL